GRRAEGAWAPSGVDLARPEPHQAAALDRDGACLAVHGQLAEVQGGVMPIHLRAGAGDYAEACLLPGDPLRARWIAETLLDDARQVNAERGLLGFTGTFGGKRVSVQATGMGAPSTAIVAEELIQLGVRRLLRVGTCGALRAEL